MRDHDSPLLRPAASVLTIPLGDLRLAGDDAPTASPPAATLLPSWRDLRLSDSLLQSIGTVVTVGSGSGCPDAGSRDGALFASVDEPDRRWYLPTIRLASPDPAFSFAATQTSQDAGGHRFDVLTLSLGLRTADPDDVIAFRAANPGMRVDPIPFTRIDATLVVGYTAQDGTAVRKEFPATVAGDPMMVTSTLLGSDVLLAYGGLAAAASVSLSLAVSFDVVAERSPHRVSPWRQGDWGRLIVPPTALVARVDLPDPVEVRPARVAAAPYAVALPRVPFARRPIVTSDLPRDDPAPAAPDWVHQTATDAVAIDVGETYASLPYRPRYTLTAHGATSIIVSEADLTEWGAPQSEFVELDVLPDFAARYPSLRAVYLGQVTGTVVAIPARYGIVRTADGLAAACDAIVDPSATSTSGCRFHLVFGVAPVVPGVELARLADELAAVPALQGRISAVTLASRPAVGAPLALTATGVEGVVLGLGATPGSFLVAFDVVDQPSTPAIVAVNLLLRELSAGPVPTLLAGLSFALDDVFEVPGSSTVLFAFSTTVGQGDLAIEAVDAGLRIANAGPVPLHISSLTVQPPDPAADAASVAVDLTVLARDTVDAPTPQGTVLGADGALSMPDGGFDDHLREYVRITVENVQQVRLTVAVNAAGLFGDGSITSMAATIALADAPQSALPTMILTPTTAVQQTVWQVPLAAAVVTVEATVGLVMTRADGSNRAVTLTHDFADRPILTLTNDMLA